jgi:hypothetical protein
LENGKLGAFTPGFLSFWIIVVHARTSKIVVENDYRNCFAIYFENMLPFSVYLNLRMMPRIDVVAFLVPGKS